MGDRTSEERIAGDYGGDCPESLWTAAMVSTRGVARSGMDVPTGWGADSPGRPFGYLSYLDSTQAAPCDSSEYLREAGFLREGFRRLKRLLQTVHALEKGLLANLMLAVYLSLDPPLG